MFTESVILSLYFETPLHAGAGTALGAIDLPVVRERTTQWPTVHASSVKGALRASMGKADEDALAKLFGREDAGGSLSVGDARLLLFPVRSSAAPFLYLTCPAVLARLKRDLSRSLGLDVPSFPTPKSDEVIHTAAWKHGSDSLAAEDVVLKPKAGLNAAAILKLIPNDGSGYEEFAKDVEGSLGLVSDDVFAFLIRTATEIQPRIKIDSKTGTTAGKEGNVFFEELVPQDALFYVPVGSMSKETSIESLRKAVPSHLQVGGDESLGRGWARVLLVASEGGSK